MLSPAAAHRSKVANQPAKAPAAVAVVSANESILLRQFSVDRNRLATIRSRVNRIEAKRGLLKNYQAWLDGFMQSPGNNPAQRDVFVWLLLWTVDVGHWQAAYKLAVFAMEQGINSPASFSRTLAETVTEQICDGLNKSGEQAANRALLDDLYELVRGQDMADQISAKLHKACGLACYESDKNRAHFMLSTAIKLNRNSGVKRLLKQLIAPEKPVKPDAAGISAKAAAAELGVSLPTVIRYAKKYPGHLPHEKVKTGTRSVYRFKLADVQRFKLLKFGK